MERGSVDVIEREREPESAPEGQEGQSQQEIEGELGTGGRRRGADWTRARNEERNGMAGCRSSLPAAGTPAAAGGDAAAAAAAPAARR
jgi:hypothetical protein